MDRSIREGLDPKTLLRERGIEDEHSGFLPDLPDCLGYLLGLCLLWLVYTGVRAAIDVIQHPRAVLGTIALTEYRAKEVPSTPASPADPAQPVPAASIAGKILSSAPSKEELKKGWARWTDMEQINSSITKATYALPSLLQGVFGDEDNAEPERKMSSSAHKPDPETKPKEKEPDQLEYFR